MTLRTLILRSLRFHARSHLGVVLGAAVGSAALIGALIVGDSVRESLRERALQRLGWIHVAMDLGDRLVSKTFYRGTFNIQFTNSAGTVMSPIQSKAFAVLHSSGTMARPDGTARARQVQVFGLQSWTFFTGSNWQNERLPTDWLILNESLAEQLGAKPGDEVILRIHKASALSREAVISSQSDMAVSVRLKVHAIARADELGNFSLQQNQLPPLNAFMDLDALNRALGLAGKVNLMLGDTFLYRETRDSPLSFLPSWLWNYGRWPSVKTIELPGLLTAQELNKEMPPSLAFEAAGLNVQRGAGNITELRTSRIFLDPVVANAATNLAVGVITSTSTVPVFTYLVNALQAGTNLTPYSMVTAAGAPYTPSDLKDDEIVISEWLAQDLNLKPGAEIQLSYFLADSAAQLVERTNKFRVHSIVPLAGVHGDRTLMPDFPGIAKAESTHDWDAGFPLSHKIRPQDDAYWKKHRGTPKAFITLAAGQRMWENRFGRLTSIRWFSTEPPLAEQERLLDEKLARALKPSDFGIGFEAVRDRAMQAVSQSQDFGGLFIGFSFFLIGAALILMALLFQFSVEQRATEIGTLLALGFRVQQVRRLFLLEGTALAFVGSAIGVIGGMGYAKLMLRGLTTIWRDATNTSALTFHVSLITVLIGLVSATLVAVITIWFVLRKQARQSASELLAGNLECGDLSPLSRSATCRRTDSATSRGWKKLRQVAALQSWLRAPVVAWASTILAVITIAWAFISGERSNPEFFFSAGSLALIGGLAGTSWLLQRMAGTAKAKDFPGDLGRTEMAVSNPSPPQISGITFSKFSIRGAARRRNRSVATVALLACGVFLIASIGAFRLDADANAWQRSSGTGGFALIGESTLPIVKDLNTREGRDALGLDGKILQGVSFVPFRVRDGDDASCLNLNRAQQPRVLGVKAEMVEGRFTFANDVGWKSLRSSRREEAHSEKSEISQSLLTSAATNEVAAIGDSASIQWALHKKIGDRLEFTGERGDKFNVKLVGGLANSILQGSLIIDEAEFLKRFPGESGYRMFLIDCPSNALPKVSAELSRALQDYGFEVTPAARRLAQFNAVQNTYLNTFQVLGGLGLLLGSAGLGVVVLRNVLERRGELALLLAVGFERGALQRLVLMEHAALLLLGLGVGLGSALVAVLPSVLSPPSEFPLLSMALTLGGVFAVGLVATWLATRWALRGNLLAGLRNE